ncbi:MAG: nucleotidyl transferase AbiEii/AbiGii toxin family protein [Thermoguttaceae bacterium]
MSDLSCAVKNFVRLFERLGVPYALMGGLAVRVYGIPRPTYDVDFTVAIARSRLPELYAAVRDLGYTVPEQYATGWVDNVAGMPVVKVRLYLEGRGIDVDIFLAESDYQREVIARRTRQEIEGRAVWLVSPEDLILLKLIAHRPRDLGDVGDILFTQGRLDEEYLRRWARQLGVLEELERVLAEQ